MEQKTPPRVEESLRRLAQDAVANTEIKEPPDDPSLARLRELGTDLWLDTGDLEEARPLWHRQFTALTTNNTLVNHVVQTGVLDSAAKEAARELKQTQPDITDEQMILDVGFVMNCHVALRLVKAFGARVSVELHPAIADDIERTVAFAERYYAVCPERFTIKIPLTPEGYCSVARTRAKGIPVNYTLGFSARQNYLAAVLSNPAYCNVFLGRLNAVVVDNRLGDGKNVGEKATLATQQAICRLRGDGRTQTRLIAASMREADQVAALAGVDVFTMPPKVAKAFLESRANPSTLSSRVDDQPTVALYPGVDAGRVAVLWDVDDRVRALTDDLAARGGHKLTGDDVREADADHRSGLFHRFTSAERSEILEHGKIPSWERWKDEHVALDDLMTESALQSFAKDQAALDDRLRRLIVMA